jgi:RNase P subunit RPR2
MTRHVDTAFERHFSEPPVLSVKEGRTHCEACREPLDPNVMHKCHGNQEFQPADSHTEITEKCPDCGSVGILRKIERPTAAIQTAFVVICKDCRTFVHPEVTAPADAIFGWNKAVAKQARDMNLVTWPKWLADLPGDDERKLTFEVPESWAAAKVHPNLTSYQGACPAVHVEGETCDLCENTGTIPPTKPETEGAQ